jgi:hypothetical protein
MMRRVQSGETDLQLNANCGLWASAKRVNKKIRGND